MKILALGGCGGMGRAAVKTLKKFDEISSITVADRNIEVIDGCEDLQYLSIDINGPELLSLMREHDAVINTVGPYYRFGPRVLKMAIEAGIHYFDINDDWEPTLDMLALHNEAQAQGITAVIGIGASPGITNLMAAASLLELDEVETIYTAWDLESAKPGRINKEPSAAMIHGMHQMSGKIKAFEKGEFVDVKPIRRVDVRYPGLKTFPCWTIGHPETVTLPRYFPVKKAANIMMAPKSLITVINVTRFLIDRKWLSVESAAKFAERLEGTGDSFEPEKIFASLIKGKSLPPLFALAEGRYQGKKAQVGTMLLGAPEGGMSTITAIPLAIAVKLFAAGQITARGVFAPEAVVPIKPFFEVFKTFCQFDSESPDSVILTTRSWEQASLQETLKVLMAKPQIN